MKFIKFVLRLVAAFLKGLWMSGQQHQNGLPII